MYYKIISDGEVVDTGSEVNYVRWQQKNGMWLSCSESVATGILSSDGTTIYSTDEVEVAEITAEEYEAIKSILDAGETVTDATTDDTTEQDVTEDASVEYLKTVKIATMSATCEGVITAGVDIVLSDGVSHHFSLTEKDQLNLNSLLTERQQAVLETMLSGATAEEIAAAASATVEYHADGELCCYYSAEDFSTIVTAATAWKKYQEAYFNSLKAYINSLEDVTDIAAVTYGMDIPLDYQSEVYQSLLAQIAALSAASTEEAEV